MKVKIVVHCLVKNEDRFIWYALNSVLPYVDKVMVWDTGSTDKTLEIIKSIKSSKIVFKEVGEVNAETFTDIRNKMLLETPDNFTWLMLLDGDEVWGGESIKKTIEFARNHPQLESIVVRTINLVGDIFHRLPESSGQYHLAGMTGHLNLRFINLKTIPGLHVEKPHGQQGYFDISGKLIQDRSAHKIKFLDVFYHHATHLPRSSTPTGDRSVIKRLRKFKYSLGIAIPKSKIPKIFFASHPVQVPDVTNQAPLTFWLISTLVYLPKVLKRYFLPVKHGY